MALVVKTKNNSNLLSALQLPFTIHYFAPCYNSLCSFSFTPFSDLAALVYKDKVCDSSDDSYSVATWMRNLHMCRLLKLICIWICKKVLSKY